MALCRFVALVGLAVGRRRRWSPAAAKAPAGPAVAIAFAGSTLQRLRGRLRGALPFLRGSSQQPRRRTSALHVHQQSAAGGGGAGGLGGLLAIPHSGSGKDLERGAASTSTTPRAEGGLLASEGSFGVLQRAAATQPGGFGRGEVLGGHQQQPQQLQSTRLLGNGGESPAPLGTTGDWWESSGAVAGSDSRGRAAGSSAVATASGTDFVGGAGVLTLTRGGGAAAVGF